MNQSLHQKVKTAANAFKIKSVFSEYQKVFSCNRTLVFTWHGQCAVHGNGPHAVLRCNTWFVAL